MFTIILMKSLISEFLRTIFINHFEIELKTVKIKFYHDTDSIGDKVLSLQMERARAALAKLNTSKSNNSLARHGKSRDRLAVGSGAMLRA